MEAVQVFPWPGRIPIDSKDSRNMFGRTIEPPCCGFHKAKGFVRDVRADQCSPVFGLAHPNREWLAAPPANGISSG